MSETIAFLVLVFLLAAMVAWGLWERQRERAMWQGYAARQGWAHTPGGFYGGESIDGTFEDGHVVVTVEMRGARAQKTRHTRCNARIAAPLPEGFGLVPRGLLHQLGGSGLPSDDAELDRSAVLFGRDAERVRAWMEAPAVRAAALEIVRSGASIADGNVTLAVFGAMGSEADLHDLVRRTRWLAQGLEAAIRAQRPGRAPPNA